MLILEATIDNEIMMTMMTTRTMKVVEEEQWIGTDLDQDPTQIQDRDILVVAMDIAGETTGMMIWISRIDMATMMDLTKQIHECDRNDINLCVVHTSIFGFSHILSDLKSKLTLF